MVQNTIEREILIDAPLEDVWSIITEAEYVAQWFGDKAEIDLRPGGAASFTFTEYGHFAVGRVETVAPPNLFAYRWHSQDFSGLTADQLDESNSTLVEFRLTPSGDGTRLQVTETGFAGLALPEEQKAKNAEGNTSGWESQLNDLVEYVAQRAAV